MVNVNDWNPLERRVSRFDKFRTIFLENTYYGFILEGKEENSESKSDNKFTSPCTCPHYFRNTVYIFKNTVYRYQIWFFFPFFSLFFSFVSRQWSGFIRFARTFYRFPWRWKSNKTKWQTTTTQENLPRVFPAPGWRLNLIGLSSIICTLLTKVNFSFFLFFVSRE